MTRIKIPIADQAAYQERRVERLREARDEGVEFTAGLPIQERLDMEEHILLTLRFNQTYEKDWREWHTERKRDDSRSI